MKTGLNHRPIVRREVAPGEDLTRLVREAPPETHLVLTPGEHRLAAPLILDRALTLSGESTGCRIVLTEGARWIVLAGGGLTMTGLAIEGAGTLIEAAGRLELVDCRLGGAVRLLGLAIARLDDCTFGPASGPALRAEGASSLAMSGCHVADRDGPGLLLTGEATGAVANCLIERSAGPGISLTGEASFAVESNMLLDNHGPGLSYDEAARGTAYGNLAQGNAHFGVAMYGRTAPDLAHNTLRRNRLGGLLFAGRSAGTSRADFCDDTGPCELFVGKEATPRLKETRAVVTREAP